MKNGSESKAKMLKTRIDLPEAARRTLVDLLNQQLANLSDLFSQTKQAHWNAKGPQFWSLHKLFDELAGKVVEQTDEVAERATALGGVAQGTVRMAAANSKLVEFPSGISAGMDVVKAVADAFGAVANSLRAAIDVADEQGDALTADLFTQIARELDGSLYFLESHLNGE